MHLDLTGPLALSRIAFGVGGWVTPRAALAASLLDPTARQSAYLLRMFAVREAALGAMTLLAADERDTMLRLGVVTDTFDTAAGLIALRSGAVDRRAGVALTAMAAGAVAAGVVSLRQRGRR